jgi:hypothetical protein
MTDEQRIEQPADGHPYVCWSLQRDGSWRSVGSGESPSAARGMALNALSHLHVVPTLVVRPVGEVPARRTSSGHHRRQRR